MYRPRDRQTTERRGIVLLVVLALLTLFAIVGISFVLYANSEANASRYFREGEAPPQPDMDPEQLLAYFLNQAIYDVDDERPGAANPNVYSALRGHSLVRGIYGYNTDLNNNNVSFNGTGRLHETTTPPLFNPPPVGNLRDDFNFINYIPFRRPDGALTDGKRHDPERPGWRADNAARLPFVGGFNAPYTYPDLNNMFLAAVRADGTVLAPSFHRPWLFGTWTPGQEATSNQNWTNSYGKYLLLRPRPQEMGAGFPYPEDLGGDVKNLIGSPGSLVQLPNGQMQLANNDSFWLDLGHPVMTAPDGTKYKPLFAPLIMDLDNRLNLNVHGNDRRGQPRSAMYNQHVSNQGWGPWEVNLSKVLNYLATGEQVPQTDWVNVFQGNSAVTERGRFNPDGNPTTHFPASNVALPGVGPHFYGPVDYDGADEVGGMMNPSGNLFSFQFSQKHLVDNTLVFPSFPPRPNGYGDGSNAERANHPSLYNFFNPQKNGVKSDLAFPLSNMEALLRYGETNSPGLTSSLYRLASKNFDPQSGTTNGVTPAMRRGMVTTHSFGLGRPGVAPWAWDPNSATRGQSLAMNPVQAPVLQTINYPKGTPIPFPFNPPGTPQTGGDFQSDWRSISAALTKIDLNRTLAPYPPPPTQSGGPFHPILNPRTPYPDNWMNPLGDGRVFNAEQDRRKFATDIYQRLVAATGAFNPFNNSIDVTNQATWPTTPQLVALRWLAQLAVNIVDFIDTDDIITAFPWGGVGNPAFVSFFTTKVLDPNQPAGKRSDGVKEFTTSYVFGTELPRVVINEVYAEYNRTNMLDADKNQPPQYNVDLWVELYNPLFRTPSDAPTQTLLQQSGMLGDLDATTDFNQGNAPLYNPGGNGVPAYSIYQLMIAKPDTGVNGTKVRESRNVLGDPDRFTPNQTNPDSYTGLFGTGGVDVNNNPIGPACVVYNWYGTPANRSKGFIAPSGGVFEHPPGPQPWNQGFYMVGADKDFPKDPGPTPAKYPTATLRSDRMTYQQNNNAYGPKPSDADKQPTIFLRRLANPYRPFNAVNNPYVTVDFWEKVQVQPGTDRSDTAPHDVIPGRTLDVRHSFGRRQPYWSNVGAVEQRPGNPQPGAGHRNEVTYLQNQPQHTFFRQNSFAADAANYETLIGQDTLISPFDWLIHLDRQLVSPMELLHVSAYPPHMLLQMFNLPNAAGPYRHLAPWFDQQARLYRVFEYLETGSRAAGVARGGRIPGLVNLNTIWDKEILYGLCDANAPSNDFVEDNQFASRDVKRVFADMVKLRTPNLNMPNLMPISANDRPFLGWSAGVSDKLNDGLHNLRGTGINDTFLRSSDGSIPNEFTGTGNNPALPHVFSLSTIPDLTGSMGKHPYQNFQLMSKLFNNVTTRSNVFAVWVTVGFFKVEDENARPVKLGAEIGKAENRNVRHRMFAVVDRTNLTTTSPGSGQLGGPPIFLSGQVIDTQTYGTPATAHPVVTISGGEYQNGSLVGSYEGMPWTLWGNVGGQPTPVLVNYGNEQGAGSVDSVIQEDPVNGLPPRITLSIPMSTLPHKGPFLIQVPYGPRGTPLNAYLGNPGPQTRFNPRSYPWVVRYFSIIQ